MKWYRFPAFKYIDIQAIIEGVEDRIVATGPKQEYVKHRFKRTLTRLEILKRK